MKRILSSLCIGTLALALTAWGDEVNNKSNKSRSSGNGGARAASTAGRTSVNTRAAVRSTNHVSSAGLRPRSYNVTRRTVSPTVAYRNSVRNTQAATVRERNLQTSGQFRGRNNQAVNRERNFNVNRQNNIVSNRERNVTNRSNVVVNHNRNVAVNNNWRGNRFSGRDYAAFRDYHRQWHDRGWWRSHYDRIIFVNGGWYFWNAGYWYPAWGYDPYAYYPYDGPIYGYNGLAPDQVIVDVQSQLQRDGYYSGPIDGVLGPMTRHAIAAFQADHGLAVTSAIDEPTLASLGIS